MDRLELFTIVIEVAGCARESNGKTETTPRIAAKMTKRRDVCINCESFISFFPFKNSVEEVGGYGGAPAQFLVCDACLTGNYR